jgi:hypothetical protein
MEARDVQTARYVERYFLYLGTLSLVYFGLTAWTRWTAYTLVPFLTAVTFFAFVVENRLRSEEPDWPKKVVYLLTLVVVAYTVLFVAEVLSAYSVI